jgi:hypothetical protein
MLSLERIGKLIGKAAQQKFAKSVEGQNDIVEEKSIELS